MGSFLDTEDGTIMTSVVFSTPGLIPIEAFTTFGLNHKPNSTNPFGFFGTGLKIGIAVCLRMKQEVVIWRGRDKYTFYTKSKDFRGKEFEGIRMKKETYSLTDRVMMRPKYIDLPFTTQLGKHWELWQAFREFQTNTMDENGSTFIAATEDLTTTGEYHGDSSYVVVTGAKFVDEYHDRGRNFLEGGLSVRKGDERIQVLEKPSKHIYYRGVRVMDLKEEAQYTYNFLMSVDLTEDRTAKYPFMLESYICEHFMESADKELLDKVVVNPKAGSYERSLGYRYTSARPSSAFVAAAQSSPNTAAKELVKAVEHAASSTILYIRIPKPFVTEEEMARLQNYLKYVFGDDTTIGETT